MLGWGWRAVQAVFMPRRSRKGIKIGEDEGGGFSPEEPQQQEMGRVLK